MFSKEYDSRGYDCAFTICQKTLKMQESEAL